MHSFVLALRALRREWRSGDRLALTIPMELRAVPVDRQHPDRVAIMYGPITLAQDEACCRRPFSIAPTTCVSSTANPSGSVSIVPACIQCARNSAYTAASFLMLC